MSHWHPLRFRYNRVLRTSLISTLRGRPPRGFCLAGGIMGLTMAHCSSVRSEGYFFLQRPSWSIFTHSSTEGICANYLIKLYFCQSIFPDSLLLERWKQKEGTAGDPDLTEELLSHQERLARFTHDNLFG